MGGILIIKETIPKRGQTERLLEPVTCWFIQTADACPVYQAVALPRFPDRILLCEHELASLVGEKEHKRAKDPTLL